MAKITIDNPYDSTITATLELHSAAALAEVTANATAAGRSFADTTITERIELCGRFLACISDSSESIASDVTRQMGKPITQARGEVATMIDRARHLLSIAEDELAVEKLPTDNGIERWIEKVPLGVVLDIAAWNYPLLIPVNVVIPAILAGNAVLLKHSSRTPLCGLHFAEAFAAAGAPEHLLSAVTADHEATATLVSDARVGYVAFTGSVAGGRAVSRAAAGRFIDVGLELGGKDPAYVRGDADIESAAVNIAEGAFYNAGQSCCGIERVYVDKAIYADFVDALAAAAALWQPGDPTDGATTLGPMAQPNAIDRINAQIEDAVALGARVVTGGSATTHGGKGRYFTATVVADTNHSMEIMTEENFAPVVAVSAVNDDDQAVSLMNDSRYGLTASIWTIDAQAARRLGRRLQAGTIFLNRCDYLDPALPWSGWKDSGIGITLSSMGFSRLVRTRGFNYRMP